MKTAGPRAGIPHVKSGAIRGLAVASASRSNILRDLPTVAEEGVSGFDFGSCGGPANTPHEIIERAEGVVVPFPRTPATAAWGSIQVSSEPARFSWSADAGPAHTSCAPRARWR